MQIVFSPEGFCLLLVFTPQWSSRYFGPLCTRMYIPAYLFSFIILFSPFRWSLKTNKPSVFADMLSCEAPPPPATPSAPLPQESLRSVGLTLRCGDSNGVTALCYHLARGPKEKSARGRSSSVQLVVHVPRRRQRSVGQNIGASDPQTLTREIHRRPDRFPGWKQTV